MKVSIETVYSVGCQSTLNLENPDLSAIDDWYVKYDTLHWCDKNGDWYKTELNSDVSDGIDWKWPASTAAFGANDNGLTDYDNKLGDL
jgi:hypothetical protein